MALLTDPNPRGCFESSAILPQRRSCPMCPPCHMSGSPGSSGRNPFDRFDTYDGIGVAPELYLHLGPPSPKSDDRRACRNDRGGGRTRVNPRVSPSKVRRVRNGASRPSWRAGLGTCADREAGPHSAESTECSTDVGSAMAHQLSSGTPLHCSSWAIPKTDFEMTDGDPSMQGAMKQTGGITEICSLVDGFRCCHRSLHLHLHLQTAVAS